jgi:hypothetical protein
MKHIPSLCANYYLIVDDELMLQLILIQDGLKCKEVGYVKN